MEPATRDTAYEELEVVTLPEAVPELGIDRGRRGTVVEVFDGGRVAMVEVSNDNGETVAFVYLKADQGEVPRIVDHWAPGSSS